MLSDRTCRRAWFISAALLIITIPLSSCGNRPASLRAAITPTETASPTPSATFTPEPTATPLPSPTPNLPPTPEPSPTPEPADQTDPADQADQIEQVEQDNQAKQADQPAVMRAVAGNVYMRVGPGTQYAAAGLLVAGEDRPIVGRNEDATWWLITTPDGDFWVADEVIETENAGNSLPVVEADPNAPLQPPPPPPAARPSARTAPAPANTRCTAPTITAPTEGQLVTGQDLTVRWACNGALPPDHSFEIRFWVPGTAPAGAHNALNDAPNIQFDGQTYSLTLKPQAAAGYQGIPNDYVLAVAVIKIAPEYVDLGLVGGPVQIRYE